MLTERIAFHLGSKPVYWYGVMVALGFVAGMLVLRWRAKRVGLPPDQVGDLVFFALVGGLLGARVMYVVSYWQEFAGQPWEIVRIDHGGLVFYGGLIGGAAAVMLGVHWRKLPVWQVADLMAQALPLGEALGRVGCFLNGCCFGKPTTSALGVTYVYPPHDSVWQRQAEGGLLPPHAISDYLQHGTAQCAAVLPAQLFDSAMNLVLCAAMIFLATRLRPAGKTFAWFLIWYAIGRFVVEFARGDYRVLYLGLTDAQWVSLVLLPVGLVLLYRPIEFRVKRALIAFSAFAVFVPVLASFVRHMMRGYGLNGLELGRAMILGCILGFYAAIVAGLSSREKSNEP